MQVFLALLPLWPDVCHATRFGLVSEYFCLKAPLTTVPAQILELNISKRDEEIVNHACNRNGEENLKKKRIETDALMIISVIIKGCQLHLIDISFMISKLGMNDLMMY